MASTGGLYLPANVRVNGELPIWKMRVSACAIPRLSLELCAPSEHHSPGLPQIESRDRGEDGR